MFTNMVLASRRNIPFLLSTVAALLTLGVAGYSLFDLSLYSPSTPERMIPGAASQDLVSVLSAIGILLCMWAVQRGREKAWLICIALLGYLFYAYALYCFEGVYNPLYLFYIAILGLVVYALGSFFVFADLDAVRLQAGKKPPRKATAVLLLLLVAMFAGLWLSIMLPAMAERVVPEASTIFVLDFALVLPLLVIEAFLLFKSAPLADTLAFPLLVKVGSLGVSVLLGALFAPLFGQPLDWPSVGIYAIMGLIPLLFALPFWRALQVEQTRLEIA